MFRLISLILIVTLLSGCAVTRHTHPARSATEQLLISTAIDNAAERLQLDIAPGTSVLVDASGFESYDKQYAIGTIREALARQGLSLARDKADAAVIVEIRSGALSINESDALFGTPSFQVPIPFTAAPEIPEIALFKREKQEGIAKIGITAYDAEDGSYITSASPTYGFSHRTRWIVLLFINWTTGDILPRDARRDPDV